MGHIITYKKIRHGYVRIDEEGNLKITIPSYLKDNENFKANLIAKGQLLMKKYQKKEHILTSDKNSVLLFGERTPLTDLYKQHNKKAPKLSTINYKLSTPKFLKEILTEYSAPILQKYSEKLGYKHRRIIIRKTKSKWGSCTHDQNISLNLSLVHLPTKYIRYVIIHEVCHLKIKNHSKRFWALVESFCPDYKNIRKEMRKMILK